MIKQAYIDGFIQKCEQHGIDPIALTKQAFGMYDAPLSLLDEDTETIEKWIDARDAAIERANKARAERAAKKTEGTSRSGTSGFNFKAPDISGWFDRQSRNFSDWFAGSKLVQNTGKFGKNLGFTYTPSAMTRVARRNAMATARKAWNQLHANPVYKERLYSNEHARAANTIYQVMKSGKLPPNH